MKLRSDARDDTDQFFLAHDREFHRLIAAINGNPIYTALSGAVFRSLADFHIDVALLPGREQLTLDEHQEILNAIDARDPNRAAKAMHDHHTRANVPYHRTHPSSPDSQSGSR